MASFLAFLAKWGPTVLNVLGALGVFAGAHNSATAAAGVDVPALMQTPLAGAGALSMLAGLIGSHVNVTKAKSELPPPADPLETRLDQLFRLTASELATSAHADKLPDLAGLIKKVTSK